MKAPTWPASDRPEARQAVSCPGSVRPPGPVTGNNARAAGVGRDYSTGEDGATMAITDYDALRRPVVELEDDSLEELKSRRAATQSRTVDLDEPDGDFELPGADLSDEELTVSVIPMRADEFRCESCFLVHHRSRLVVQGSGRRLFRDCA